MYHFMPGIGHRVLNVAPAQSLCQCQEREQLKSIENWFLPVAQVAYQVIFEPGISQFRGFEPRRVHTHLVKTR